MVLEVKMPALSPTMTEGKIVSWDKKEGDSLSVGDVILEVETDKAVMEVEAQDKGVLGKILCQANETIAVGKTIALILKKGESADALKDYKVSDTDDAKNNKNLSSVNENVNIGASTDSYGNGNKNSQKNNKCCEESCGNCCQSNQNNDVINNNNIEKNNGNFAENNRIFASPLAKNIAKINNINIENITAGSGPNGRIVKADVEAFLASNNASSSVCIGRNPVEFVDVVPSGMRSTVARRLTESKQQVPHWYLKITANMTNFVAFRNEVNKLAKVVDGKPEYKVSANDIVVMAVAKALQKNPSINASWENGKLRKYNNVDVSVAVAVGDGIFTPIVKNADQLGLLAISSEVKRLVKKARDGKLQPQEFNGGSISISNLGMFGVQEFYSIINQPQSCIVAVGTIENSVVATEKGEIVVQPTCTITLSADHRVIDGAVLAKFAGDLKRMLENPAMMNV